MIDLSLVDNGVLRMKTVVFTLKFSAALDLRQQLVLRSLLFNEGSACACIILELCSRSCRMRRDGAIAKSHVFQQMA